MIYEIDTETASKILTNLKSRRPAALTDSERLVYQIEKMGLSDDQVKRLINKTKKEESND